MTPVQSDLKNKGLRGISVTDTKISHIDGNRGILIYRGYRIEELAKYSTFPEVLFLLMHGKLPRRTELKELELNLLESRHLPHFAVESLSRWPAASDPMDVLQAAAPLLAMADPRLHDENREANVRKSLRILAGLPAILSAWHRIRQGKKPLPPDENLSHTGNFLWQLTGAKPDPECERALDVSFILHAEHTLNASTFACRTVVSTRAHLYAGLAAGIGALSGSLHGGANVKVLELLLSMEAQNRTPEDMARWVNEQLDRGERLMGMGHPVYRTEDPRSLILKDISESLAEKTGNERRFRLLNDLEEQCVKALQSRGKARLKANVDYYSGLLHFMLGIPTDMMTAVFAAALSAGWCAHMIEEKHAEAQGRPALYRPESDYIGNYCGPTGCRYLPLDAR